MVAQCDTVASSTSGNPVYVSFGGSVSNLLSDDGAPALRQAETVESPPPFNLGAISRVNGTLVTVASKICFLPKDTFPSVKTHCRAPRADSLIAR